MSVNGAINDDGTLALAPNLFGLSQYSNQPSFFGGAVAEHPVSQGTGWGIIVGFSAAFFAVAGLLVWADQKFAGAKYNNEQFNTAGRAIGPGLIAVDVCSHWTWAGIILNCGTYTWFYGAGSVMWFGTGSGTMTVWLFCIVAIELKHRAPKAHTYLELIEIRWGSQCHLIFGFFGIFTNFFVSLSMMQAAVQVFSATTNVNQYALSFIIPLGVSAYAVLGGLKATFTTSYLHTVLLFVAAMVFMFKVYCSKEQGLGSIDEIWRRLQLMKENYPIPGNRGGSYLTAWSIGVFEINLIYVVTALCALFTDQTYWQSAIAASPEGAVNGYALGSFLYLGIVYCFPLALGVGGLALDLPIDLNEVLNLLVFPASAYAFLGTAGVVLICCVIFMAVTSSGSGEMLAVSSLFTFDLYRKYIRPKAGGPELVLVSRIVVVVWALVMAASLSILNAAEVNVYWLTIWNGIICTGAVGPCVYLLAWDRCTGFAAGWCGAVLGCVLGVFTWLIYPALYYNDVSIDTTEKNGPVLAGAGVAFGVGVFVPPLVTFLTPKKWAQKFDWDTFNTAITFTDSESTGITDVEQAFIKKWRKRVWAGTIASFILLEIVWPLLTLPAGDWSLPYFRFQVVLGFIIGMLALLIGTFLPLWEGRHDFMAVIDWCLGRKTQAREHQRHAIPDGLPPVLPKGTIFDDGKSDLEKPIGAMPVKGDDTAHGVSGK